MKSKAGNSFNASDVTATRPHHQDNANHYNTPEAPSKDLAQVLLALNVLAKDVPSTAR